MPIRFIHSMPICLAAMLLCGCGSDSKPAADTAGDVSDSESKPSSVENDTTGSASSTEQDAEGSTPPAEPTESVPKTVSLFDGKTFDGWEGNLEIFRIEDGAIVGGTLENKIAHNEFLTSTKEYANFELRLKFRLKGNKTNAGIQIRSRRTEKPAHEMIGYQADLGQQYWGCLYDESRRRKVLAEPNREELALILKPDDWNDYRIRCEGKRIQLWINGYQTVDYTEDDASLEQTGLIGLQIHGGPPGEAWYKDIEIDEL